MITVLYEYPGDPRDRCDLVFGAEFLQTQSHREIRISAAGMPDAVIPVGNEIICDACNAEVREIDPCAVTGYRLYCWPCAQKYILPYVRLEEPSRTS
jgi:hypothetical protein